jgi:DNA-binding beta-propeller fold protein YncE
MRMNRGSDGTEAAARRMGRTSNLLVLVAAIALSGCTDPSQFGDGKLDLVWGRAGVSNGRFEKPRAIAIDNRPGPYQDRLYIVDMTARIQVFDPDGNYLFQWNTPAHKNGNPTGMNFDRSGNLLVADTHYYRLLIYAPDGTLQRTIGGTAGHGPGEFGFVTSAVEDRAGNYYISEYGEYDRIQKFTHDGKFLLEWGSHGQEPNQFVRPQSLDIDEQDRIWVADSGNHCIKVFDTSGKMLFMWGKQGEAPGQLSYPYGLKLDGHGHVLICEYGNSRIQKFTHDGKSLGCWGGLGHERGQMYNPWALALDSQGRIHVVDSNNHRVQRIRM